MHPVLFHIGPILIPSYGATAALGVLLALMLALRTARMAAINPNQLWNLCIVALFTAIVGSRLLLIIVNWTVLRSHPAWLLGLAMIHHPLLTAVGALLAGATATIFALKQRMPLRSTADALAAPLALGLAFEQLGSLLVGAGYGTETTVRWAVVYTSPLAAHWSGTPLGLPVHPVQVYAAIAFLTISISLLVWMPYRRQQGDIAGLWLLATGVTVYLTEFWRDPEGRGTILRGALDGPQLAAILMVLAGALMLLEHKRSQVSSESTSTEAVHAGDDPNASENSE